MSRVEFSGLPIAPSGSPVLAASTELNVLVDLQCLFDPERGPQKLSWLQNLKASLPEHISDGPSQRSFHWRLENEEDFYVLQKGFELEPCVVLVSPEGRFFPHSLPNDPRAEEQRHLIALNFAQAWPSFFLPMLTGQKVTIAVVDTGVDFSHPDLTSRRWRNTAEIPGNGRDDDRNGYVDDVSGYNFANENPSSGPQGSWPDAKHGTHVAGLAAAQIDNGVGGAGVNGVARVMALNVFGSNTFTRSSILENALRYAADNKADVINLSLGGREYSRTMRSAIMYAIGRGSFIVSAAGNEGTELCDNPGSFEFVSPAVYGAGIDGMIVTGSVDASSGRISRFSNRSSRLVEIMAPGAYLSDGMQMIGLLSTVLNSGYDMLAGTSMSAPVLSGAAALALTWLKTYGHRVTPAQLETVLKEASQKRIDLKADVQEGRTLDLSALAAYLKEKYPPQLRTLD